MVDSSRLDVDSVEKEKDVVLDSKLIPEPQRVYIHDEASLHEIRDEIGALRDLFSRRLMNDKQKNELIQTLTDGATFAFIEPFIHDIILLLDRIERSEDEVVRSIRDELLEILRLTDRRNHLPGQLSGGQQQRTAIGRALFTRPALILADEPTGNLDSENSSEVISLLKKTSEQFQQTILMITHSRPIAQTADRILSVSDGVVTDLGRSMA